MLKHIFISSFFIVPYLAMCQHADINYRNQLKLSPFRAINVLNPGIEISYERIFNNKFSTQFSGGVAINVIGKPFKNLHGYNIAVEEKYFFSRKSKSWKYISLVVGHSNVKYEENTSGVDTITNLTIMDTFTIARKITSVAFKYGIQYYKKHFVFDMGFGVGLKYRSVKHYNRTFEYKGPREPFDLHRAANVEKQGIAFYLPVKIQIGYRF